MPKTARREIYQETLIPFSFCSSRDLEINCTFLHILDRFIRACGHGEMNRWLKHQPEEILDKEEKASIKNVPSRHAKGRRSGNNLVEDARRSTSPPGAADTTAMTRRSSERPSAQLSAAQPHHAVEVARAQVRATAASSRTRFGGAWILSLARQALVSAVDGGNFPPQEPHEKKIGATLSILAIFSSVLQLPSIHILVSIVHLQATDFTVIYVCATRISEIIFQAITTGE
ncbi:hypothetical protein ACQJBY_051116 [Aegilops geniculata]